MRDSLFPLRWALGSLATFAIGFVAVGASGWGARAANEQAIGEVSRWCERVSGGLLREPVNTLGNLGFVIAGLVMFFSLARDVERQRPATNQFIGNQPVALLYAAAALFLGPGSMLMHGTHTRFGAWMDNVSMVAYILVPWLINLAAMGRWRRRTLIGAYGGLLALFAFGYWNFGPDLGIGLDLFGLSIGFWVISEVLYRWWSSWLRPLSGLVGLGVAAVFGIAPNEMLAAPSEYWWVVLFWVPAVFATGPAPGRRTYTPWFWGGMASFFVAYAIWKTGTAESTSCRPDSLLQAHAVWHLLTALATFSFFWFLRTERSSDAVALPQEASTHS